MLSAHLFSMVKRDKRNEKREKKGEEEWQK